MTPVGVPETTADRPSADDGGLSSIEAAARLAATGPNALPEVPGPNASRPVPEAVPQPADLSLLLRRWFPSSSASIQNAVFIAAVLLANGVIGTVQEYWPAVPRAALRELAPKATVLRDGAPVEIDAREVVPGDLVLLEAGVRVPADLVLVAAQDLRCDESLTGESAPVAKHAGGAGRLDAARTSRAFAGTAITRGRGRGIVTATGPSTEIRQDRQPDRRRDAGAAATDAATRALLAVMIAAASSPRLLR